MGISIINPFFLIASLTLFVQSIPSVKALKSSSGTSATGLTSKRPTRTQRDMPTSLFQAFLSAEIKPWSVLVVGHRTTVSHAPISWSGSTTRVSSSGRRRPTMRK